MRWFTRVPLPGSHLTQLLGWAFSFSVHHHGFCPQQRKVVWNLLLLDGSEGPSLIDYAVTQRSRLSPTPLLVAHAETKLPIRISFRRRAQGIEVCLCIRSRGSGSSRRDRKDIEGERHWNRARSQTVRFLPYILSATGFTREMDFHNCGWTGNAA